MEPGEPAVGLYDFLYRDSGRISSYYAQIFSGRLSSLEETNSERDSTDRGAKVDLHVAGGDVKRTQEVSTASKQVTDPHDVITTDVLSFLTDNEHIHSDIAAAPHGAIVLAQGTLVFVDRSMAEIAVATFDMLIQAEERKPKAQRNGDTLQGIKFIRDFLSKISIPSAFLLQTPNGIQVAGTIKEAGMEETISSYYFKHGTAGLADVFLIGIKELPSVAFTLPGTQLIGAGQQAAQALSDMLLPPEAIRVTPIALFRKLL